MCQMPLPQELKTSSLMKRKKEELTSCFQEPKSCQNSRKMTPDLVHPNQAMAVVAAMAAVAIKAVADMVAAVGEATVVAVAVAIKAEVGSKGTVITLRVAKVEVEVDMVHKAAATGNLATVLHNKGWKPEVQDPHKVGPGGIMTTQSSSETWVNPISHKLTQFSQTLVSNQ